MVHRRIGIISGTAVILFLGGLLVNLQRITPAPHLNDLGSGSLLDSIFAIALAALVLFLAAGLGSLLVKHFKLSGWTFIERTVIGLPLGLAAMAYGVFFMGLAGWIKPVHLVCWLIIVGLISFKSSVIFLEEAFSESGKFKNAWSNFSLIKKVIFSAGFLALLLALFQAFTPPWDYDGLAYHLQGPRLFLEAGRIIPTPENWLAYYPFTWEMIYLLGMGLGSDIFTRLIHFSTLILLLLATYAFGRSYLPKPGGWIAAAILLGIPILPLWGNAAYTDLAWALFQFLAVGLFLLWVKDRKANLLILSGVTQGLALGSKYFAFSGAGILFLFILWYGYRNGEGDIKWKNGLRDALLFGLSALIIASPWYIKNILWTGNPIFPLVFPQTITDPSQLSLWLEYMRSYGVGYRWIDYLLLPLNIYMHHDSFGSFMGSMEMPNPLFLLVFVYPFLRRAIPSTSRKTIDLLAAILVLQFTAWAFGAQQIRFLLPLFPGLSILTAYIFIALSQRNQRLGKIIAGGLVGGMVAATLIFMGIYMGIVRPDRVLFEGETKSEFLTRVVRDHSGIEYINKQLPAAARVMFLWDARGYYCDGKCIQDVNQSGWGGITAKTDRIAEMAALLRSKGITHIFLSKEDLSFFLLKHDPKKQVALSYGQFSQVFVPACTASVYEDDWVQIFKLPAVGGVCQ